MDRGLFWIAALVLFIITTVLAFLVDSVTTRDLIGLVSAGLACLTVSHHYAA